MNLLSGFRKPRRRKNHTGTRLPVEGLESRALLSGHSLLATAGEAQAQTQQESPVDEEDMKNGGFSSSTVNVLTGVGVPLNQGQAGIGPSGEDVAPVSEEDLRNGGFGSSTVGLIGKEVDVEVPVHGGVAVGNPGRGFFDVFLDLAGEDAANSFFDVFTELAGETGVDSFFDVFTELAGRTDADSFFDVFTELVGEEAANSFFDVWTELSASSGVNGFFDVFTELQPEAEQVGIPVYISRGDGTGQAVAGDAAATPTNWLDQLQMRGFAIADLGIVGDWDGDGFSQIGHGGNAVV